MPFIVQRRCKSQCVRSNRIPSERRGRLVRGTNTTEKRRSSAPDTDLWSHIFRVGHDPLDASKRRARTLRTLSRATDAAVRQNTRRIDNSRDGTTLTNPISRTRLSEVTTARPVDNSRHTLYKVVITREAAAVTRW